MKVFKLGLVASALMTVSGVALAQQKDIKIVDPRESPYVIDPRGVVVRNPFGLCWRTAFWSVDRAANTKIEGAPFPNWTVGCECDRELMKPPVCDRHRHRRHRRHHRRHRRHHRRLLRPARR